MVPTSGEITRLLVQSQGGDPAARERLLELVYPELRRIAAARMRGERAEHTLQATALVHEAYLRLAGLERIEWRCRAHFLGVAAQVMRQVLVDHARRRRADKRDSGSRITLSPDLAESANAPLAANASLDVLDLERALEELEGIDPQRRRLVELRAYGGLSIDEAAAELGTSASTVKRQWRSTMAWLRQTLAGGSAALP